MSSGLLEEANDATVETTEVDTQEEIVSTKDPSGEPPVDIVARPEYIPENFWDKENGVPNVEGLAKSYAELRKAFNNKNNDKPGETAEEYDVDEYYTETGHYKVEGLEIPRDDPGLKAAMEAAKEAGLGVKQAHNFIAKYLDGMKGFLPQPISFEEEMSKLGTNAEKTISGIKVWVDGMKNNGDINDEVYGAILELGKNAAGIKALDVLRQKTGEMSMPIGEAITGSDTMSLQDWYSASYETHAHGGESRVQYDERMREVGRKLIGTGYGTFSGQGYGVRKNR